MMLNNLKANIVYYVIAVKEKFHIQKTRNVKRLVAYVAENITTANIQKIMFCNLKQTLLNHKDHLLS